MGFFNDICFQHKGGIRTCIFCTNSSKLIMIIVYITNDCSQLQAKFFREQSKFPESQNNYITKLLSEMALSNCKRYRVDAL